MMWFGYQRVFSGAWVPCIWHSQFRPTGKKVESKVEILIKKELHGEEIGMSLSELEAKYPPPGETHEVLSGEIIDADPANMSEFLSLVVAKVQDTSPAHTEDEIKGWVRGVLTGSEFGGDEDDWTAKGAAALAETFLEEAGTW